MRFERDRLKGIQIMQSAYLSSVSTFGNLAFFNCLRMFCWISTIQSIMSLLAFLMAAIIAIKWWRQYCNWGFLLGLRLCHIPGAPAVFVSLFCSDQICCFAPFFEFVGSCKGERLGKEGGCVQHSEEMRVSVFGNILYGNCCYWFELVIRGRAIMIIMVDNNGTIECGLNVTFPE